MNRVETAKLVAVGMAPFGYMQDKDPGPIVEAWSLVLGDLPYGVAQVALVKVLSTARNFPVPADIREAAASLSPSTIPASEQAWAEVLHNMKMVGYMRTPQWSNPIIGEVVKAMWGSWPSACEIHRETLGVERAQFLKMYTAMTEAERTQRILPTAVRDVLSGTRAPLLQTGQ